MLLTKERLCVSKKYSYLPQEKKQFKGNSGS